jgi:ATP-dependent Clp protease ATP-binding subunit ClpA
VLVVNLNQFRALKQWQEEAAIADLLRSFRDQLRQCPRSVFILDELQSVTPALVAALVSSFQPPAASWPHGIVGAFPIVILISDLGSERLGANMTRTEAVVEISAVASARFLGEGAGANSASTASVLHNNLVPFLPLSLEDLSKVAAMQLQVLQTQLRAEFGGSWVGKLTWHPRAAAQLARICFGDAACYQEGGRGVESKVQHELQTEVEALVGACLERAERAQRAPGEVWGAEVCSDNVDVDVQVSEVCSDNVDVDVQRYVPITWMWMYR